MPSHQCINPRLLYWLGKHEGDWPCHHSGNLPIDRVQPMKFWPILKAAADALRMVAG
jgi:hypothetical protein